MKYNVKTFDEEGNLINDDDFVSILSLSKVYKKIPYHTLHYIANYSTKSANRKPSKKIASYMERIQITPIEDDTDIFEKA